MDRDGSVLAGRVWAAQADFVLSDASDVCKVRCSCKGRIRRVTLIVRDGTNVLRVLSISAPDLSKQAGLSRHLGVVHFQL